jgi:hypothetical protein
MIYFLFLIFHMHGYCQYHMLGTSRLMDDGCIMLTPDMPFAEGLAYNYTRLNLQNYFEIQFDVFLGDKEEGADGITFVIHNDIRGFDAYGQWGECMGYGSFNPLSVGSSINPSIAVEFDTYQNSYQNDPACDHVAYLENGSSRHDAYWNGGDSIYNIEDNNLHDFRFRWNPSQKLIEVFWDGVKVVSQKRDLINDIFDGEDKVIWGFTASTGRKYNLQYFCLIRLASLANVEEIYKNG